MNRGKAERVAQLFKSALEHPREDRASFLTTHCAEDTAVRMEVESLLDFTERGSGFLEEPAVHLTAESFLQNESALRPGQIIAGYTIRSPIGAGGMGEVYLSDDTELGRRVALKLLHGGLHSAAIVRRFRQEERILAGLNHPNIAQLYGGGVTGENIPFFAMEYIEGIRLDEYCSRRQLGVNERLALFRKICSAVQYAHQHLVVHRDIKPSNILVTEEGEPKLLDFGIAKLLDGQTLPSDQHTLTIAPAMTPDYASPEQLKGEAITTASDIYSLGVLLYELLTGTRPYRLGGESNRADAVAGAVTRQQPRKPSLAVTDGSSASRGVAADAKSLRGDLDNIVLMAMRLEPTRRYASVAQFSDDIRRHLERRPVLARRDTPLYRTTTFVRRNRLAVAAAALVAVAVLGGLVATSWQARKARQQRDLAQREKVTAERINSFLQRMLSFSNQSITSVSSTAQKKEVTVNDMLDRIAPQVQAELADEPEVRAQVLRTIGSAYSSQGRYEAAEKTLRAALETETRLNGEENVEVAAAMFELGVLYYRHLEYDKAAPLLEKATAFYERQRQSHSPDYRPAQLVRALDHLGALKFTQQADSHDGKNLISEALGIAESAHFEGDERRVLAAAQSDAGAVELYTGDAKRGESLLTQALSEFRRDSNGAKWGEEGATLTHLGVAALATNRLDEAQQFLQEGEQILRQTLGDGNGYLATNLNRQASVLLRKDDAKAAQEKASEALTILQKVSPNNRFAWIGPIFSLADISNKLGHSAEAEGYLRQALEIVEQKQPRDEVPIAKARVKLSQFLASQGRFGEADALAQTALRQARDHLPPDHPVVKEAAINAEQVSAHAIKN